MERIPVTHDCHDAAVRAAAEEVRRSDEHERPVLTLPGAGDTEGPRRRNLARPDDERTARRGIELQALELDVRRQGDRLSGGASCRQGSE